MDGMVWVLFEGEEGWLKGEVDVEGVRKKEVGEGRGDDG